MHHKLLSSVQHAPMSWFDTTPRGRINNRFSADLGTVDEDLPGSIDSFCRQFFYLTLTFAMIVAVVPLFACLFLPLCVIYYYACGYYLTTSRELKRWQSV